LTLFDRFAVFHDDGFLGAFAGRQSVYFFRQRDVAFIRSYREAEMSNGFSTDRRTADITRAREGAWPTLRQPIRGEVEIAIAVTSSQRGAFRGTMKIGASVVKAPRGTAASRRAIKCSLAGSMNFSTSLIVHFSTIRL